MNRNLNRRVWGKLSKQLQAASHIKGLLEQRGCNVSSRLLRLEDDQQWMIIESRKGQVGIDVASGVWVRSSDDGNWRCLATPCTLSSALQAIEFLVED